MNDLRETIIDMSDDYLLLDAVLEDNPAITVKRLAVETGLGTSTLYRYRIGGATIPSIVWRALWRLTGDERILALITGGTPTIVVRLIDGDCGPNEATIKRLLAMRRRQIAVEQEILEIIKDSKIDENDREMIAKYKKDFPAMIESQNQIYQAITGKGRA